MPTSFKGNDSADDTNSESIRFVSNNAFPASVKVPVSLTDYRKRFLVVENKGFTE